jgi:DNA-binding MarR family transcriptional regulator
VSSHIGEDDGVSSVPTAEPSDEPRWLDADEMATWIALASVVAWLPSALDAQLQRDAGLSHFEYQVLAMLSESSQRTARMSDVAKQSNGSLSRLSHVVDRLAKRGWVARFPDPADGRYTLARLTDAGWEKVVGTAPGHLKAVRQYVFDPLSKSQTHQLHDIADRIRHAINPDDNCLPPRAI